MCNRKQRPAAKAAGPMFLKASELDGNNGDPVDSISDDQVVPFSATSPRRNILSRDSSPDLSRSPQYQERLNRARSQKAMSFRKTTTAGPNARQTPCAQHVVPRARLHRAQSQGAFQADVPVADPPFPGQAWSRPTRWRNPRCTEAHPRHPLWRSSRRSRRWRSRRSSSARMHAARCAAAAVKTHVGGGQAGLTHGTLP